MTSTGRKFAAWFACFAILLGVLAPTISHALAEARGQSLVWEICRSDTRVGQATVKPSDGGQLPASGDPFAHCSYCLPHGGIDSLLPPVHTMPAVADAGAVRPVWFQLAPSPQQPPALPPARGPPTIA